MSALAGSGTDRQVALEVRNLSVEFEILGGTIRPVDDVSLQIFDGDIFALVGESGCGKSTLATALIRLVPEPGRIVSGDVLLRGSSLQAMNTESLRRIRAAGVALVLQAAMGSFNPVITIEKQVEHVLEAHPEVWKSRRKGLEYFDYLLDLVRLPTDRIRKSYESQLSGGMRQRVAIAFGLLLKPDLVILDEPTTALDVINQGIVIEVLKDLQAELGVTIVFVTHDLAVVAELASRVGVMYAGRLVQSGSVDDVFYGDRRHPYVRALLTSIPNVQVAGRAAKAIAGSVPRLDDLPRGCRFAPRCPVAEAACHTDDPELILAADNAVACHPLNRRLEVVGR